MRRQPCGTIGLTVQEQPHGCTIGFVSLATLFSNQPLPWCRPLMKSRQAHRQSILDGTESHRNGLDRRDGHNMFCSAAWTVSETASNQAIARKRLNTLVVIVR